MTNTHSAVIDAVMDLAQEALTASSYPYIITRGSCGSGNCISCEPSYGTADRRFFSKNGAFRVTLVFNAKHKDMQAALNMLEQVQLKITRMQDEYPEAEAWKITGIWTNAMPMMIAREEDNTWLYAASVYIDYYVRGD